MPVDVEEIRKLVRLMEEAGLLELEVEDRSGKVRLKREPYGAPAAGGVEAAGDGGPAPDPPGCASEGPAAGPGTHRGVRGAAPGSEPRALEMAPGTTAITSPMVGTFYRAPAPDAQPFVGPGDVVQPGQVVCIIEAMKMMNEVCAETAARIVSVQAENGKPVEYGSPLFLVELLE